MIRKKSRREAEASKEITLGRKRDFYYVHSERNHHQSSVNDYRVNRQRATFKESTVKSTKLRLSPFFTLEPTSRITSKGETTDVESTERVKLR